MWSLFNKKVEKEKKKIIFHPISNLLYVKVTKNNILFYNSEKTYLWKYFPNKITSLEELKIIYQSVMDEIKINLDLIDNIELQKIIDLMRNKIKLNDDFVFKDDEDFSLDEEAIELDFNKNWTDLLEEQYVKNAKQSEIIVDKEWNDFLIFWNHFEIYSALKSFKELKLEDKFISVVLNKNFFFKIKVKISDYKYSDAKFSFTWYNEMEQGELVTKIFYFSWIESISVVINNKETFLYSKWYKAPSSLTFNDIKKKVSDTTMSNLLNIFEDKIYGYLETLDTYNLRRKKRMNEELYRKKEKEDFKELMQILKLKPMTDDLQNSLNKMKRIEELYQIIDSSYKEIEQLRDEK